eukprot:CAMPEP_0204838164 /NCGR_PEP_ID=MMETSP1346-20131115/30036_1 /ASSEMBLY_ACC=CAM_ASM_000771 /TAXON_ID=215587 /ORGANISM="Aplanochytrium stocchinoi, Strain GSBS06" /LENGTH=198 /DNA_ID=CAMNT_0051974035 /DNA_START=85 /DNA_END=678 /DNA_ORIENTATION=+
MFLKIVINFLMISVFAIKVAAFVGDETYEERRRLVKAPEGLKIEGSYIAHVEGDNHDCDRVKAQIDELKKKRSTLRLSNVELTEEIKIANLCLVHFTGTDEIAREVLDTIKGVLTIEQDMVVHAEVAPASWGLDRIDQENLPLSSSPFLGSYTGSGVFVYVIDTGINKDHQDFGGRAIFGDDFVNENKKEDMNGHGTH